MIRVLLCGEGATELGNKVYKCGRSTYENGVLPIFMKKCAPDVAFDFVCVKASTISSKASLQPKKKFASPADAFIGYLAFYAKDEKCTHIAYHRDVDKGNCKDVRKQVEGYFVAARDNGLSCIAIVPQRMTESWLLADICVFLDTAIELPKPPEELWGDKHTANHPKKQIETILNRHNRDAAAVTFAEIANLSRVDKLIEHCPLSFEPFYHDMLKFSSATNHSIST